MLVQEVPPTTAEIDDDTSDDLQATTTRQKASFFEDDYLKPDVAKSAEISRDGTIFSNLFKR